MEEEAEMEAEGWLCFFGFGAKEPRPLPFNLCGALMM